MRNQMAMVSRIPYVEIHYIYVIRCKRNQKKYVGVTCDPKVRAEKHLSDLRSGRHSNKMLQEDFNRYGEKSFSFSIVDATTEKTKRTKKEKEWMLLYETNNPTYGYNNVDQKFYSNALKRTYALGTAQ